MFHVALDSIAGVKLFNYVVSEPSVSQELINSKLIIGDYNIIPN